MKKLLTIITLFVSSFFFISLKEAKADEIINYDDNVLDTINDEFFTVRDIVINFAKENSYNYLIQYKYSTYYVYFIESSQTTYYSSSKLNFSNSINFSNYKIVNGKLQMLNESTTLTLLFTDCSTILDSSIDIYHSLVTIKINYKDRSYIVDSTNKVPTIYDIYLDINNIVPTNPHQEELEKIESFYNVIIEKLSYIGEVLVSNYMYLSIIVIFLLILVFEMIFRRYL